MWVIETTDTFDEWFDALDDASRASVLASLIVLQERGPMLSRPHADTVNGSCYSNMKELRVQSKGEPIRAFFAFDTTRKGILLCAGNKGVFPNCGGTMHKNIQISRFYIVFMIN